MSVSWTEVAAAIIALRRIQEQSAARTRDMVSKLWANLGPSGLWDDALSAGVAAQETIFMMALIESMRRLGWSYGKQVVSAFGGNPASGLEPWLPNRLGVDPFQVSLRTADEYRHNATQHTRVRPDSFTDPNGGTQAQQWLRGALTDDWARIDRDAMQAAESSAVSQFSRSGYETYMRVPHPEASKSGTCGLCWAASMRLYSTSHLMPLHAHCHCSVVPSGVLGRKADRHGGGGLPMTGQESFGDLSNRDAQLLKRIYEAANGGSSSNWDTSRGTLESVRMGADGTIKVNGKPVAVSGVNSEVGPVFNTPKTRSAQWHQPTRSDAREQLERVAARADGLDRLYRRAASGRTVKGTVLDRSYEFHPSAGIQRAMQANSLLGRTARQRIKQLT